MANHEWSQQALLARMLEKWIDPATTFWTATDPVTSSPLAGFMRKKRGVKAGVPDTLIWHRRRSVAIELKGRGGRCSPVQRAVREALLVIRVTICSTKSRAFALAPKTANVRTTSLTPSARASPWP
jgi:hypothetical protein